MAALDMGAMLLSGLCLVHCLALPLLVAALPWAMAGLFTSESFHFWMLIAVVPSSFAALLLGCRRHRDWRVLAVGACGVLLLSAGLVGSVYGVIAHRGETVLTVCGALLLAAAHTANFVLHRRRHPDHPHGSAPLDE
ncbi:MerC domain-containing protein [Hydrocarboniphaga sp.]|uniref:MerC domain-containing protein n=1 Tax=Hydrocarboniphaga sp. TaxID=2033016 RepID=UPI0026078001|nr:MerC domain-containing protein [Hydrocarboniphaga sp.]